MYRTPVLLNMIYDVTLVIKCDIMFFFSFFTACHSIDPRHVIKSP